MSRNSVFFCFSNGFDFPELTYFFWNRYTFFFRVLKSMGTFNNIYALITTMRNIPILPVSSHRQRNLLSLLIMENNLLSYCDVGGLDFCRSFIYGRVRLYARGRCQHHGGGQQRASALERTRVIHPM